MSDANVTFLEELRKAAAMSQGGPKLSPKAKALSRIIRGLLMRLIFKKKKKVAEAVENRVRKALKGRHK